MKIALGTMSPPKIAAIESAIEECVYFKGKKIELISKNVNSGISDMPISMEENMEGALNRAHNVAAHTEADLYLGMEGGTHMIGDKAYLFGVIYILDNSGKGHYGISNMMEVPEIFRKRIYDNGEELGPVLSEITGQKGAYNKNGAFGHWSDDMLTRKDQFMLAFFSAIPNFYNEYYKM